STLPVVVGDRGAVRMCLMPFSRQIRSNSTSPVPGPNRPGNTLPLSVRISRGTPWVRIDHANASHTGRAVARSTTRAEITNRLWSSTPDTIDAFTPVTIPTPPPAATARRPTCPGRGAFPPAVVRLLAPPRLGLDQPVTDQTPIDRRPPRQRHHPLRLHAQSESARTPPRRPSAR